MPSTLSEKIRVLFTVEDVRSTLAQTILGTVLTGGFNLLLLLFAWSYDNYWLTLLASLLCAAILGFTAWLLVRNIAAALRLEKSDKQSSRRRALARRPLTPPDVRFSYHGGSLKFYDEGRTFPLTGCTPFVLDVRR